MSPLEGVAQGKHIDGGRCATAGRPAPRLRGCYRGVRAQASTTRPCAAVSAYCSALPKGSGLCLALLYAMARGRAPPPRQISRVGCLCRAAFLRLARQVARDEQVLHTAIDLDRDIGTRLNSNGGNVGVSLDAFPHRGGGFRAVTTGPCAPTDYLSSLALDSGAACGADRITTQRGRCARCFSQTATRAANIV